MKTLLATVALLLLASAATQAAEPKPPEGLSAARKALAAAVAAGDVRAVAAMSRFPLAIDAYETPPKIIAKRFNKTDLDMLFGSGDRKVLDCVRAGPVVKNDPKDQSGRRFGVSWYADCDGNNYFFAERDSRWLFIGYQNVNE